MATRPVTLGLLFIAGALFPRAMAAESKPVKLNLPMLQCNESETPPGRSGNCIYKTKEGDWAIDYYREGTEKTTLKGVVKNLIVIMHPGFNHANLREWWSPMMGPGMPLDPAKHMFLSVGIIGDGQPKVGVPSKLTAEVIVEAQMAIVKQLYPKADFILGGPSLGANNALLFTSTYGKQVKKLFLISGGTDSPQDVKNTQLLTEAVLLSELQTGPYMSLSETQRYEFWTQTFRGYVKLFYGPTFFDLPAMMSELGQDPSQYKSRDDFFKNMLHSWSDWAAKTADAVWAERLNAVLAESAQKVHTKADFKFLPKDILLVSFAEDQISPPEDFKKAEAAFKAAKKNVTLKTISDPRGHMGCCSSQPPKEMMQALSGFFDS